MFNFNEFSENIALLDENSKVYYCDLQKLSFEFKSIIVPNSLVLFPTENTLGLLAGYLGILQSGNASLLLDMEFVTQKFTSICEDWKPAYIWKRNDSLKFSTVPPLVQFMDYGLYEISITKLNKVNPNLALLLSSSGSTGNFKLVRVFFENLFNNTTAICKYLHLKESDRTITNLPINYSYGLSVLNTHILSGASLFVTQKNILNREFWTDFIHYEITNFNGLPFHYSVLKKMNFEKLFLPKLRLLTQAGGKLEPELQIFFSHYAASHTNCEFYCMYGQTEAISRISYLPSEYSSKKTSSVGIPISGGLIELIDSNGNKINSPSTIGEICFTSETIGAGIALKFSDLKKSDEFKGKLNTGDLGWFDEDGFLYLSGRKDRTIKVYGTRINLDELSNMILNVYSEWRFACIGEENLIVFYCENSVNFEQLKLYLLNTVKLSFMSFNIRPIDVVPVNKSGKVDYQKLALLK